MARFPGLEPKPVTGVSSAARAGAARNRVARAMASTATTAGTVRRIPSNLGSSPVDVTWVTGTQPRPRSCARDRRTSAVAQLRRLVADLGQRRDEQAVRVAVHRLGPERGDPVAVLERQLHPEVALQATADGVTRE